MRQDSADVIIPYLRKASEQFSEKIKPFLKAFKTQQLDKLQQLGEAGDWIKKSTLDFKTVDK
jgi:hypothetical protein